MIRNDAWLADLRARLDDWSGRIEQLDQQARHADPARRARLEEQLVILRRLREDTENRLQTLLRATGTEPPPVLHARSSGAWQRRHQAFERLHG
ncbi:MAG: hypothetical protein JSR94_03720 [Proteobacteria bacterium]|nr:hypothetical protein [Pseudomonadota bacterium]HNJ06563.1 hypothetical protein [Plasticicumulans sp.]